MLSGDYSLVLGEHILCISVFACICEGARFLGIGATKSCEVLCGFWELNLAPLEGASEELLTVELLSPALERLFLSAVTLEQF